MDAWNGKFSIIDFYLSVADKYIVYGQEIADLELIDVGKLDSLEQAELFLKNQAANF